jgi:Mor family transcriptional regulator
MRSIKVRFLTQKEVTTMKTLREMLGKRIYNRIVNEFGGRRIWVPKNRNLGFRDDDYFKERNDKIILLYQEGKSVKEISEMFSLSSKRVYHILNNHKKNNGSQTEQKRQVQGTSVF